MQMREKNIMISGKRVRFRRNMRWQKTVAGKQKKLLKEVKRQYETWKKNI